MSGRGLLIAATASRSGKTTITLGLARALGRKGHALRCAKSGPDYIDPGYLAAASGAPCVNLDGWAMTDARLSGLAGGTDLLLVEGAMGLFDGAPPDGRGSSADLAKRLGLPVILIADCASLGQSVAALLRGFTTHDPALDIAGVILNRVGSERHGRILKQAMAGLDIPVLGMVPRAFDIHRPSRHLGLVQASEHFDLDAFLDRVADHVTAHVDLDAVLNAAGPLQQGPTVPGLPPLADRIAVARDAAFTFTYPHLLDDWHRAGASVSTFSPLADEAPDPAAQAIYLPGGYPELHAQRLTRAGNFRAAMGRAAAAGTIIHGECGGYMVLGHAITDARGIAYPMLGLLDLETSFAKRKLHLGYRQLTPRAGPFATLLKGHEFHYASTLSARGTALFDAADAEGGDLGSIGLVSGTVSGSFAHVIDRA